MKKYAKILSLLLALVMLASIVTGCGTGPVDDIQELLESAKNKIPNAIFEEQVLIDHDSVKVTATALEPDADPYDGLLILTVENLSDKALNIICESLFINNCQISPYFAVDVDAGATITETLYIEYDRMVDAGIKEIGQIELEFTVSDPDTYDAILETELITIQTTKYDKMVTPTCEGTELYNENGIRIVYKELKESYGDLEILLYFENHSGQPVTIDSSTLSLNGYMVDGFLYCKLPDGKIALDDLSVGSYDLETNNIQIGENDFGDINTIDMSFEILNSDTYDTVASTGTLNVTLNNSIFGGNQNNQKPPVNSEVVYDENGLKITYTGIEYDDFNDVYIKLLIENNTDQNVTISSNCIVINSYMTTDLLHTTINAGQKSNEEVWITSSELESVNITKIGQVDLYFEAFNAETYDDLVENAKISIQISKDGGSVPQVSGTELYNKNGIRIVFVSVIQDYNDYPELRVFIENNSDQTIEVDCDDLTIDGVEIDSMLMTSDIYPGAKCMDEIWLYTEDLDANNITTVGEVQLIFEIRNAETYEAIDETDTITFTAE